MAAQHKKIGEVYNNEKPINKKEISSKSRKSKRGFYNDHSEVNDIITNLKKYRKETKKENQNNEKLYFREQEIRKSTPKNKSRPASMSKNRPSKMRPANHSFIDPSQFQGSRKNNIDQNIFFENKRYKSEMRGQENIPNKPFVNNEVFYAPLYNSQGYGSNQNENIKTNNLLDLLERVPFQSKKSIKANNLLDSEPKPSTSTQLSQLKKVYINKNHLVKYGNSSCINHEKNNQNLNLSGSSNTYEKLPKQNILQGDILTKTNPIRVTEQQKIKGQRRIVTAINECTYGKETTKSSDKTSMMHTKNSIKTGKGEMSYMNNYPDSDSISLHSMTVFNQINNMLGKQENQSVEDIHYYFVAFYQRTKNMLKKVEDKSFLDATEELQKENIENDEKSIISVDGEEIEQNDEISP